MADHHTRARHNPAPAPSRTGVPGAPPAALLAIVLALLCAASWVHQAHYDFQTDDAYISYRYAQNWALGAGPVFNRGERVEGYTNFLLVAFLALVRRLGGDIIVASRTLGTLSCWGLIAGMFWMMRSQFGRSPAFALAGAAALALHAALSTWARSGLETLPLAFLVLVAQFLFLHEHRHQSQHWRSALLFAAVALLRADGLLFLGGAVVFLLLRRQPRRAFASLVLPFLGVFLPYFFWRWSYYGWLLPNTYYVKTGGDLHQLVRGFSYVYDFVATFGGVLLFALPLLLLVLRDPQRDAARLYLGVSTLIVAAYVVLVGGDFMPMSRFFMPLLASLILLALEAIAEILARVRAAAAHAASSERALALLLVTPVVVSGFLPTLNKSRIPYTHVVNNRIWVAQWSAAGKWFAEHLPPGKVLACGGMGAVSFFSNLQSLDMLGLTDVHIAHVKVSKMGRGTAGHEKSDMNYILSRKPDLFFLGVGEDASRDGEQTRFADGSVFTTRCVRVGRGPSVSPVRGEEREADWILWYQERATPPGQAGGGGPAAR